MGKHHLDIGDTFETTTKRMMKKRQRGSTVDPVTGKKLMTYEVLRPGMVRYFQKGQHRYQCKVIGLRELRTGLWPNVDLRWWQFTYLVEVINS